jgi:hypothetical protein
MDPGDILFYLFIFMQVEEIIIARSYIQILVYRY